MSKKVLNSLFLLASSYFNVASAQNFYTYEPNSRTVLSYGGEADGTNYLGQYTFATGLLRTPDGAIVAAYSRATGHGNSGGAAIINRSLDEGKTWLNLALEEIIALQDPNINIGTHAPTLTVLQDGRLMMVLFQRQFNVTPSRWVKVLYSSDNGKTWGIPIRLPDVGTLFTTSGGPAVQVDSGRILVPVYWRNINEARYCSSILYSDDDGYNWYSGSKIACDPNPNSTLEFEEPHIGKLNDGRLMALIRTDNPRMIWVSYSSNEGETWSDPVAKFPGWGFPAWTQAKNGAIIACSRRDKPTVAESIGFYRVSWDNGQTWGPEQLLADPNRELGTYAYAGIGMLNHYTVGVLHAADWLSAISGRTRLEFMKLNLVRTAKPSDFVKVELYYDAEVLLNTLPNVTGATNLDTWSDLSGLPNRSMIPVVGTGFNPFTFRYGGLPAGFQVPGIVIKNNKSSMRLVTPFSSPIPQPFAFTIAANSAFNGTSVLTFADNDGTSVVFKRDGLGKLYTQAGGLQLKTVSPIVWPTGPSVFTAIFSGANSEIHLNGKKLLLTGGPVGDSALSSFRLNGNDGTVINDVRQVIVSSGSMIGIDNLEKLLMDINKIPFVP